MTTENRIFINCPFDKEYSSLFKAIIFTVLQCGFLPVCALEQSNGGELRMDKIFDQIGICELAIHDISRVELDADNNLPRFNMPFELGIFLGARKFGGKEHEKKSCLIFEAKKYDYMKYISDLNGFDISCHEKKPSIIIEKIRNFLQLRVRKKLLPSPKILRSQFTEFDKFLKKYCRETNLDQSILQYVDLYNSIVLWMQEKNKSPTN